MQWSVELATSTAVSVIQWSCVCPTAVYTETDSPVAPPTWPTHFVLSVPRQKTLISFQLGVNCIQWLHCSWVIRRWNTYTDTLKQESYRRTWLLMTMKISWRWARRASVAAVRPEWEATAKFAPRLNNNATMSKLPLRTALTQYTSCLSNTSKQTLLSCSFLYIATLNYSRDGSLMLTFSRAVSPQFVRSSVLAPQFSRTRTTFSKPWTHQTNY